MLLTPSREGPETAPSYQLLSYFASERSPHCGPYKTFAVSFSRLIHVKIELSTAQSVSPLALTEGLFRCHFPSLLIFLAWAEDMCVYERRVTGDVKG